MMTDNAPQGTRVMRRGAVLMLEYVLAGAQTHHAAAADPGL
jgi:hypothetical protein